MPEHTFLTPEPISLSVDLGRGRLLVTAAETSQTVVRVTGRDAESVALTRSGRAVSVVGPRHAGILAGDTSLEVEAVVPTGSDLALRTGSAGIEVCGPVAELRAKSGSGRIDVETARGPAVLVAGSGEIRVGEAGAELRAKSGSGDVEVASVAASAVVSTGSGDVRIGRAFGPVVVKTGSGDLAVEDAADDVSYTTGSGDLVVGAVHRGTVTAKGASGDVRVGVAEGVPVWTDIATVSGEIHSRLPSTGEPAEGQEHVELRARTVSGDVLLVPA